MFRNEIAPDEKPSSPNGIRTRVATLRGWCPRPLDDGAAKPATLAHLRRPGDRCARPTQPTRLLDRLARMAAGKRERKAGCHPAIDGEHLAAHVIGQRRGKEEHGLGD